MTEEEIIRSVWENFQQVLGAAPYRLYLMGSRAAGSNSRFADFDFLVKGAEEVPDSKMAALQDRINRIDTLYSIDLVDFHRASEDFRVIACKNLKEVVNGRLRS